MPWPSQQPWIATRRLGLRLILLFLIVAATLDRIEAFAAVGAPEDLEDGPSRALIIEVQRGLAAVGLYAGPVDGEPSAALRQAIRSYQAQRGLPVDGVPSTALLSHLGGIAEQAAALRARIDTAKVQQIEEARIALAAAPDVAARLAAPALGVLGQPCDAVSLLVCVVAEAARTAARVPQPERRDWVLLRLIGALARGGEEDAAWSLIARLDDPRTQITALRDMAASLAMAGRGDRAAAIAAIIPLARPRVEAWIAVAESGRGRQRDDGLELSIAAARQGIAGIDQPHVRVALLARVATAAADPRDARDVPDLDLAHDLADALEAGPDRDLALGHIAGAQAALGRLDEALATVATIGDERRRAPVLLAACLTAVLGSQWPEARALANSIAEPRYRAVAEARLAAGLAGAGRPGEALEMLAAAESSVDRIASGFARNFGLGAVVAAKLAIGQTAEAQAYAQRISSDVVRAEALVAIARVVGGAALDVAAAAIADIVDPVERLRVAAHWALAFPRTVGSPPALPDLFAEAKEIVDPWQRARALAALAEALTVAPD